MYKRNYLLGLGLRKLTINYSINH